MKPICNKQLIFNLYPLITFHQYQSIYIIYKISSHRLSLTNMYIKHLLIGYIPEINHLIFPLVAVHGDIYCTSSHSFPCYKCCGTHLSLRFLMMTLWDSLRDLSWMVLSGSLIWVSCSAWANLMSSRPSC